MRAFLLKQCLETEVSISVSQVSDQSQLADNTGIAALLTRLVIPLQKLSENAKRQAE
ncbi:hypothetical protein N9B88_01685 [Rubripirellula sp.]|jgi:hypothetical protein|nr:hypothetical protein [Rubripirellula sp.]